MTIAMTIPRFEGELLLPGDDGYDQGREVWNAIVDRRPALIVRCTSADDVAAAVRMRVRPGSRSRVQVRRPQRGRARPCPKAA